MENSNLIPVNEQEVLSKIFDLVADNDELKEKISFNQEMIYTLETELSGLKKLRVLDFMERRAFVQNLQGDQKHQGTPTLASEQSF